MKAPFSVLIELQKYKLRGYDYFQPRLHDVWNIIVKEYLYTENIFNFALTCTFFSNLILNNKIKEDRMICKREVRLVPQENPYQSRYKSFYKILKKCINGNCIHGWLYRYEYNLISEEYHSFGTPIIRKSILLERYHYIFNYEDRLLQFYKKYLGKITHYISYNIDNIKESIPIYDKYFNIFETYIFYSSVFVFGCNHKLQYFFQLGECDYFDCFDKDDKKHGLCYNIDDWCNQLGKRFILYKNGKIEKKYCQYIFFNEGCDEGSI